MLRLDNRENARIVEMCYKDHTTLINPIIDWTTDEVWEFIKEYKLPYCCLYDEGFHRLGCIGCPMGSRAQREYEFVRWSKYKDLYLTAFRKMIDNRGGGAAEVSIRRGSVDRLDDWELDRTESNADRNKRMTAEELMEWWID